MDSDDARYRPGVGRRSPEHFAADLEGYLRDNGGRAEAHRPAVSHGHLPSGCRRNVRIYNRFGILHLTILRGAYGGTVDARGEEKDECYDRGRTSWLN